ncbi:hypothetical protein MS3_00010836 [Schistosoma haematobium]|nr:hypothetical protein MS3_00010836 [Schistosoma haematobium]RTG85637.1 uncharacterized protein DC041_0005730 [Schistosoma bovis]KAH9585878.1 hypothetical protein MS3_00010836 [Schistosoma haematobium]RTG90902.1 uncharacterized protein DC041_0006899 [Schistosoma bovis]CAH8523115.1 unnamed protein product [Schistosoma bovis]CAH8528704.1 unnamed protein product [Schistosoma haematobium]
MTDWNVDLDNKRRLICQCLCPCLIDGTLNDVRDENLYSEEEGIFSTSKARALSNLLFLKDDVFEIEASNLYEKKAITLQPWNSEHNLKNRHCEEFQSPSQVIKRYLQDEAKQINRYVLMTILYNVTGPIV